MSPEIEAALARLEAALGTLEGAVARHLDVDGRTTDLETELQIMGDDRSRLALDLEGASAQLARMGGAVEHVGRRVQMAIGTVETVLARAETAGRARLVEQRGEG